ncbi:MAG: hypothetical protein ABMA64_11635 [Myxococcota bacterium]
MSWLVARHLDAAAYVDAMSWDVVCDRGGERRWARWDGRAIAELEWTDPLWAEVSTRLGRALDAADAEVEGALAAARDEAAELVRAPMGSAAAIEGVRPRGRPELVVTLTGALVATDATHRLIAGQWWSDVDDALDALGWEPFARGATPTARFVAYRRRWGRPPPLV